MTHVLHRDLRIAPRLAIGGAGPYIFDDQGNKYLDACGGAAVSILGHNHPRVTEAIIEQIHKLPYAHTSFFTTSVLENLANALVAEAPGMEKALFVNSGSEAVEAALKLSRQYFVEIGEPQRRLFIARKQSYHGSTLGALGLGGNEWRRQPFYPLLNSAAHIAPCFEYRWRRAGENQHDFGLRVANELEAKIFELGPENVAGFVAETVVGATTGAVAAVPGYFPRIRQICDRYGILLILDEVMCGMGRTGSMFAYTQEEIVPDMVTIAKGLAAGYQPIGALLTSDAITGAIEKNSGYFQHGHTFMGHAVAAAAALATIQTIHDDRLIDNVQTRGSALLAKLKTALGDHAHVGDVRGRGLLLAVEFVMDRDKKTPFDPGIGVRKRLKDEAASRGLLCYTMGGTVDGKLGDHALLAPPYTLDDELEDEIVDKFTDAAIATLGTIASTA